MTKLTRPERETASEGQGINNARGVGRALFLVITASTALAGCAMDSRGRTHASPGVFQEWKLTWLSGMSHGQTGNGPAVWDGDRSCEVWVIRDPNYSCGIGSAYLYFDEEEFFAIRQGEHVRLVAPVGEHVISAAAPGYLGISLDRISFRQKLEEGKKYYFTFGMSLSFQSCFITHFELIPETKGREWIFKTKPFLLRQSHPADGVIP